MRLKVCKIQYFFYLFFISCHYLWNFNAKVYCFQAPCHERKASWYDYIDSVIIPFQLLTDD